MSEAMKPCPVADELFAAIEHGDAEHRAWLRAKLDEFFAAWNTRHTESPLGPVADELERLADAIDAAQPDVVGPFRIQHAGAVAFRQAAALVRQSSPATAREVEELRAEVERLRSDNRFFAEAALDFHRVCKANTSHHEITITREVTEAFNRLYGHVANLALANKGEAA